MKKTAQEMETMTSMSEVPWIAGKGGKKSRIEDEYILGDIIGRGATSTIYCCLHRGRTEWACKAIRKKLLDRKIVEAEIGSLLRLRHPNLVEMREAYETENELMIIMDMASGGELFERIVEQGRFSEEDAATAVRQILSALQYLHAHGVVHRDLKPENLLYESENEGALLKVTDFGMSRMMINGKHSVQCGAAGYSAPEIILKKDYGPAVDMWSVGVMTYIILCGFEPFWDDAGDSAVLQRVVNGNYNFDSDWWDGVTDSAKDLISKLLQIDPEKRLTAKDALNHPWVCGETVNQEHMEATQKRLREIQARRKFRAATHAVLAARRAMALLTMNGSPKLSKSTKIQSTKPEESSTHISTTAQSEKEDGK